MLVHLFGPFSNSPQTENRILANEFLALLRLLFTRHVCMTPFHDPDEPGDTDG